MYVPCPSSDKIRIADGSLSPIASKCLIKLSNSINLQSILRVPKLACNLLFINKLTKDLTIVLSFFIPIVLFRTKIQKKRLAMLER